MARSVGFPLPEKRRKQLQATLKECGAAKAATDTGLSVNTIWAASGGSNLHQSTAVVILSWLDKNMGKS